MHQLECWQHSCHHLKFLFHIKTKPVLQLPRSYHTYYSIVLLRIRTKTSPVDIPQHIYKSQGIPLMLFFIWEDSRQDYLWFHACYVQMTRLHALDTSSPLST